MNLRSDDKFVGVEAWRRVQHPREITKRFICINADVGEVLKQL